MNVENATVAPDEDAIVASTGHDEIVMTEIERPRHEAMQVVTRVGAEVGAVMMIVDTHVVTEEAMEISTAAVVAAETALARVLPVVIIAQEMIIAIATVMIAAITEVETKINIEGDVHLSVMPLHS